MEFIAVKRVINKFRAGRCCDVDLRGDQRRWQGRIAGPIPVWDSQARGSRFVSINSVIGVTRRDILCPFPDYLLHVVRQSANVVRVELSSYVENTSNRAR